MVNDRTWSWQRRRSSWVLTGKATLVIASNEVNRVVSCGTTQEQSSLLASNLPFTD